MLGRTLLLAVVAVLPLARVARAIVPGVEAPRVTLSIESNDPEERLRSAMTAVNAYVEKHRKPFQDFLRRVETPKMHVAAKAIVGSGLRLSVGAKLLATVRLAAHARDEEDAVEAIDIMITQRVRERLFQWLERHERHGPCDEEDDMRREETVAEGLRAALGEDKPAASLTRTGACSEFIPYSYVGTEDGSNNVSVTTTADAGRTFDDVRVHLDPRSWADCSTVWTTTHFVETTRSGRPVRENGRLKRKRISADLGDALTDELLYEQVQCDGKCSLEVLLKVTATKSDRRYQLHYDLADDGQLSGSPRLVVDGGDIIATRTAAGRVKVVATKNLAFGERVDADMVRVLLHAIDMNAHLQRLACCCNPDEDPECSAN